MEWQNMFGEDEDEDEVAEMESQKVDNNINEIVKDNTLLRSADILQPICSVRRIEKIGGGRGIFANQNIPSGTLILAEKPIFTWPRDGLLSDPLVLRQCVEEICTKPEAYEVTKFLHPITLTDAEPDEILKIQSLWNSLPLLDQTQLSSSSVSPIVTQDELIRVALVLQHNGFASGLYKYLSLVNHSCLPNCIKFSPLPSNKMNWKNVSEIWSIQPIKSGDEITICYLEKIEIPYRTMRNYLLQNHQFLCTCTRCASCNNNFEKEIVDSTSSHTLSLVEEILDSLETLELSFDVNQYPLQADDHDQKTHPETDTDPMAMGGDDLKSSNNSDDIVATTLGIISYVHKIIELLTTAVATAETTTPPPTPTPPTLTTEKKTVEHILIERDLRQYDCRDLTYLLCRYHQIILTLSIKLIDVYYQEKDQLTLETSAPVCEDEVTAGVFSYLLECYIKHTQELYKLQFEDLSFSEDHPLLGETIGHLAQGIKIALHSQDREKEEKKTETLTQSSPLSTKTSVLDVLYTSEPQKYSWAKSNSTAKIQMRQFENMSSRIDQLYKINYELLQQNFKLRKLMFENNGSLN